MNRQLIILIIVAIVATIGIYQLPKVVVENEALEEAAQFSDTDSLTTDHGLEMDSLALSKAKALRESLMNSENPKISINFADSLGRLYLRYNRLDSALKYAQEIIGFDSTEYGKRKAGLLQYSVFEVTGQGQMANTVGALVRKNLEPLAEASKDPSLRVKVGMTYVGTSNPMQGILMIREVLEDFPDNVEALFSLGFLAIQSGQMERAVERFEKVLEIEPENWNAALYLGISWMELGELEKAKAQFEKVLKNSNSIVLEEIAQSYLKEIK